MSVPERLVGLDTMPRNTAAGFERKMSWISRDGTTQRSKVSNFFAREKEASNGLGTTLCLGIR